MEIRDGFIVGIYNYCDGWCTRCAFTSHCRVFADKCESEASLDLNLTPEATAPQHPSDTPPPAPTWLQELLSEIEESAESPMRVEALIRREPPVVKERDAID